MDNPANHMVFSMLALIIAIVSENQLAHVLFTFWSLYFAILALIDIIKGK